MGSFYQYLSEKQIKNEISLFGFSDVSKWEAETEFAVSPEFYPMNIFPEAETAVVIGVPVLLPILETTPSVYYNEHYKTLNSYLDSKALELSFYLNDHSFPAIPIPRDGYSGISALQKNPAAAFSHKHAAYHAGLGSFGQNNTLLTPEYGPRVRFTTVLTAATTDDLGFFELKSDFFESKNEENKKIQKATESLCIQCMACAKHCPANAVSKDKTKPYPKSKIDKMKCVEYNEKLGKNGISPCGVCIKVCPIGEDRKHFNRKNIGIYNENQTPDNKLLNSWEHVRKYGTK